ncbi:uncharacterized protein LOC122046771 [Zingiber officinale]|uniref:Uncharacterized protein n=1 Tax=Zingiber officinale TaxID=94328 RepID=A0A8J5HR12_ZINOF|nr:uncharacterized protein LOC122046771 [Zingiber officinale]XP_042463566.1 uncharacterized protein LOC122046771 [Zingiber officinale]KAG6525339.1 hypothetical protein ZIOFF_015295 [Zingiber officinale]
MNAVQSILHPTGGIVLNGVKMRSVENLCSACPCLKASRLPPSVSFRFQQDKLHLRLIFNPLKNKRCASVLTFGKKGDSLSENEELPKKLGNNFRKELTVQDVLREYEKEKQSNGSGSHRKSFWAFWDRGDGSSGLNGEGFQVEELVQVIMAIIGVIFLYILITKGQELSLLARDYIRYLLGAKASARLIRTMDKWSRYAKALSGRGL